MQRGKIELITGCMFSGKTEELIRRTKRAMIAKQKVVVFKPKIDDRYAKDFVISHSQQSIKAIPCSDSTDILSYLRRDLSGVHVVAIDEIQFFDYFVTEVVKHLRNEGIRVICAGLTTNFRGELFNRQIADIFAMADEVTKLTAVCVDCGSPAIYSQRYVDGMPAKYDDDLVVVGGEESYQAKCYRCFVCEG